MGCCTSASLSADAVLSYIVIIDPTSCSAVSSSAGGAAVIGIIFTSLLLALIISAM